MFFGEGWMGVVLENEKFTLVAMLILRVVGWLDSLGIFWGK